MCVRACNISVCIYVRCDWNCKPYHSNKLMKTSQKISCEPITARKGASKKGLVKTEFEIFELSKFSILALYWNQKLGKLGNSQILQRKQILWNLRLEKIFEFSEFSILVWGLKSKPRKPRKFPDSSNKTHSMKFTSFVNISV